MALQAWCEAGSGDMPLDGEPETDSELGDWLGQTSESQAHLTPSLHAPSFSVRHKPQGLDPVQEASSEGYKSSAPVGRVSAEADVMGAAYRQESSQLGPSTQCAAAASLRLEARSVIGSPSCALAEVWSGCRQAAMMMRARALLPVLDSGNHTLQQLQRPADQKPARRLQVCCSTWTLLHFATPVA